MHPLFELRDQSQLESRTSPFNVRGVVYCRMLEDARAVPGGVTAFRKGLAEEGVADFFAQSFRWTEWYDALPMNAATLVLARMAGVEPEIMARFGGETTARQLVPRMFRILLGFAGIGAAAQHISWILPWFFDFGDVRVIGAGNDSTSLLLSDVPAALAATYVNSILGFMAATAELIGRAPATASYTDVTTTGERDGFARVSIRCTLTSRLRDDGRVVPGTIATRETTDADSRETAILMVKTAKAATAQ
ncbi:MAG TPA: hypothetical protein VH062_09735 [Polyangiaceae bacterium]|jgi:hypothetical protein|nr:hypothetical protein [Polyangiaceae bacterium]